GFQHPPSANADRELPPMSVTAPAATKSRLDMLLLPPSVVGLCRLETAADRAARAGVAQLRPPTMTTVADADDYKILFASDDPFQTAGRMVPAPSRGGQTSKDWCQGPV